MDRAESNGEPLLRIRLFGGMSIRDSRGADYLPRSRKTRAVVAVLALNAPKPVLRMDLTGLLWSQREREQARASLRQAVHELQDAPGPAWTKVLVAERHHLAFGPRDISVDAVDAIGPMAPKDALLSLMREGFLEDLGGLDPAFDEWTRTERLRLRAHAGAAGESLLRDAPAGPETMTIARALLRIDPAHDAAWRALIQGHHEAGDRAAALFAVEQWREATGLATDRPPPPDMADFLAKVQVPARDRPRGRGEPGQSESGAVRSGLRLGIRRMRVIGGYGDDDLAAGLAEEITTALSRFRWISCVSVSSMAALAGDIDEERMNWPDIDLDLVLDGTIQRGGDRLRIIVRLLDLRLGGEVIWANRFDRAGGDTLTIQEEVGAAIVAQIDPELLIREGERAASGNPRTASPRELVLRAVPAIYRLDRLAFHGAGALLEAALKADPGQTDAMACYAYWHLFLVGQGWAPDPEGAATRAAALADTAVSLDPNDARALTLAGHVRGFLMKRPSEATVLHDRAISLNPNLAIAWCFSGFSHSYLGAHDTAIARMRQAIELSPSDPHLFFFQAAIVTPHLLRGEFEAAAAAGRAAIELNPWFSSAFKAHLAALGNLGCEREAADVRARLLKLEPGFTVRDAIRRSPLTRPEDVARYAEGLRGGGLAEG